MCCVKQKHFSRLFVMVLFVRFSPSSYFPPALQKDCELAERQPSLKPEADVIVGVDGPIVEGRS